MPTNNVFSFILRWNIIDSLFLQLLLVAHNMALRMVAGPQFHGTFSVIFSLLYFLQGIHHAGFDTTLGYFWQFHTSRTHTYYVALQLIMQQVISWFILMGILSIYHLYFQPLTLIPFSLIISIILIESIKRQLRSYLFFNLENKRAFWIECIGLLTYIGINWFYYLTVQFSLYFALMSLMVISLVQIGFLSRWLISWVDRLPLTTAQPLPSYIKIWSMRFSTAINHSIGQLFTTNFIIPYFAEFCSLSYVSIASIMGSFFYLCYKFIQRTVGMTFLTGYAQLNTPAHRQNLTQALIYFLFVITLGIMTVLPLATHYYCTITWQHLLVITILFAMLTLIEGFFALYDKLYTLTDSPYVITTVLSLLLLLFFGIARFLYLTNLSFIILLLMMRVIALMVLAWLYYARKN